MRKNEILRYLMAPPGPEMDALVQKAAGMVEAAAAPKSLARPFPLAFGENSVILAGHEISSRNLFAHLKGCTQVWLMAVTLGAGVDSLIRRSAVTDPALAPVLQAAAAAYTEEQADLAQEEIQAAAAGEGLFLRPRYSPGYGDFALEEQGFFFSALEIGKRLGVTLTDSFMMVPTKSVTAVVGLSPDPSLCHIGRCMTCDMTNCPFRKEDQQ